MKRILTICLCLMMVVLMPSGIKAEEAVIIDETTFKDPLFRDYVVNNFDINKDGYLEDDEIMSAVKISIGNVAVVEHEHVDVLLIAACLRHLDHALHIINRRHRTYTADDPYCLFHGASTPLIDVHTCRYVCMRLFIIP